MSRWRRYLLWTKRSLLLQVRTQAHRPLRARYGNPLRGGYVPVDKHYIPYPDIGTE
jgi:hypothetical protein